MENTVMTIGEIRGGAAIEMMNAELARIYDDIADPNKKAGSKRKMTLEVEFAPSEDGRVGACTMRVRSTLGKQNDVATTVFFGFENGHGVCTEHNRNQPSMFSTITDDDSIPDFQ